MISVQNLSHSYGEKLVLHNLTLSIPSTGITVLTGHSGCGKTTFLRLLAGLDHVQSGTITAPRQVSMLFQEDRLFPWRTVAQQLTDALPHSRHGELSAWLSLADLSAEAHAYPSALSGGMGRRLALVRALSQPSALLLLDEPFTGIDPQRIATFMDFLKSLPIPTVLVSHQSEILAQCDTIVKIP